MTPAEAQKRYRDTIEAAIAKAKASGALETVQASDGAVSYAFPRSDGSISWGVNAAGTGRNVLRGVRRPDGADEAVS
jgi:hypothetical protein